MTRWLPSEFSACRAPDCPLEALCWRKLVNPAEQWPFYGFYKPEAGRG